MDTGLPLPPRTGSAKSGCTVSFCSAIFSLANRLIELLDAAARTSSMIENINGLLKQFLHNRRAFRNSETLQNYLNLFTLWHNMRVFATR